MGPVGSSVQLSGTLSSTFWTPTGVVGLESVEVRLKMCSKPRPSAPSDPKRECSRTVENFPQLPLTPTRTELHSYGMAAPTPVGSSVQPVGM